MQGETQACHIISSRDFWMLLGNLLAASYSCFQSLNRRSFVARHTRKREMMATFIYIFWVWIRFDFFGYCPCSAKRTDSKRSISRLFHCVLKRSSNSYILIDLKSREKGFQFWLLLSVRSTVWPKKVSFHGKRSKTNTVLFIGTLLTIVNLRLPPILKVLNDVQYLRFRTPAAILDCSRRPPQNSGKNPSMSLMMESICDLNSRLKERRWCMNDWRRKLYCTITVAHNSHGQYGTWKLHPHSCHNFWDSSAEMKRLSYCHQTCKWNAVSEALPLFWYHQLCLYFQRI